MFVEGQKGTKGRAKWEREGQRETEKQGALRKNQRARVKDEKYLSLSVETFMLCQ